MADKYDLDEELEEKPFDLKLFLRMMGYFKTYGKEISTVAFLLILNLVVGLLDPILIKIAIDDGIMKKNALVVTRIGIALLVLYGISFVANYYRIRLINRTTQGLIYDIRKQLFEHIQTLSFRFFDGRPVGKIMSRVTNDVQAISNLMGSGIATMITDVLMLLGILGVMFYLNFKLTFMAISVIPLLLILLTQLKPRSEKAWTETRKTMANINANVNETLQGIKVIQAFSRQKHNIEKFEKINMENYKSNVKAIIIELFMWPSVELIGMLGTCVVVWFGARQVISGEYSIGTIIAFTNYVWRFWAPLSAISRVYSQILSAMASADRIFHILDTSPEIKDAPDAIELDDIEGRIEFRNVTFGYNPDERMVLHNISFTAEPGQIIALVGPTGAGKTSIINLLMRFYDPVEGSILVDGHDIRDIKISSLRRQVGMVLQDSFIFSGTIRENILFGKLDATEEEIIEVSKATKVLDYVERFPQGFDTEVEERGARLSAGQRQLLAFARALIAQPRILILDEATSNVDTETEKHIQEAIKTLFSGRTSIVIAHRLSTIEHADKILVIDEGKIVEEGTHTELLEKKGVYYNLYLKQFRDDDDTDAESIIV